MLCTSTCPPTTHVLSPCHAINSLRALGSLWCSASEVVCIPQAGVVSDRYSPPPDLCVLGSVMSLLIVSGFAVPVAHCVFRQGGGVHVYVCVYVRVCMCVCVCVCVQQESPRTLTCSLSSQQMAGMFLNSSSTQSR